MKWNVQWKSSQSSLGVSGPVAFSKGSVTLPHILIVTLVGVAVFSFLVLFSEKPQVVVLDPVVPETAHLSNDVEVIPSGETYSDGDGNTFVKGRLSPELKQIHDEALAAAETKVEFDDEITAVELSENSAELDTMIAQLDEQARQIYARLGEAVPTSDALWEEIDQTIDVDEVPELSAFEAEIDQLFPTSQITESDHEVLPLKAEDVSNN